MIVFTIIGEIVTGLTGIYIILGIYIKIYVKICKHKNTIPKYYNIDQFMKYCDSI